MCTKPDLKLCNESRFVAHNWNTTVEYSILCTCTTSHSLSSQYSATKAYMYIRFTFMASSWLNVVSDLIISVSFATLVSRLSDLICSAL